MQKAFLRKTLDQLSQPFLIVRDVLWLAIWASWECAFPADASDRRLRRAVAFAGVAVWVAVRLLR